MHNSQPKPILTIGFLPKQYYQRAALALRTLFSNTDIPFNLLIVDSNMSPRYRSEIEALVSDRTNCRFLESGTFLQPNECKNLVVEEAADDYVCILENDTIIEPRCIESLLDCVRRHDDNVIATPVLYDGDMSFNRLHHDPSLGYIQSWTENDTEYRQILPEPEIGKRLTLTRELRIDVMETHMFLFHKKVADRMGAMDPVINTREPIDTSLSAYKASIPIMLEPRARGTFTDAQHLETDDLPFWRHAWNVARAQYSHEYLKEKWNLVKMGESMPFVKEKYAMLDSEILELSRSAKLPERFFHRPIPNPGFSMTREGDDYRLQCETGENTMSCNDVAALVYSLCDGERTVCDIVLDIKSQLESEAPDIVTDIDYVIKNLETPGALELRQ